MIGVLRGLGVAGGLALLLLATLILEIRGGAEPARTSEALTLAGRSNLPPVLEPLPFPPLADFVEIRERPLFNASRQPQAQSGEGDAGRPRLDATLPPYELSAVVIDGAARRGLFRQRGGRAVERRSEGELLDGWEVSAIRPGSALLIRAGREHELVLRKFKAPTPPAAKSAPDARRQRPVEEADPGAQDVELRRPRRPKRGLPVPQGR